MLTPVAHQPPDSPDLTGVLAGLAEAYALVVAAIEAVHDPQAAFNAATTLSGYIHAMRENAALVRAQQAHRIWLAEELTLAALGERLSVSTQRAHQLVQAGRPDAHTPTPEETPT